MTTRDKKGTNFVDFYGIWIAVRCFLVKPSKFRRLVHTASWFCSLEQLVSAFAVNSNYDSLQGSIEASLIKIPGHMARPRSKKIELTFTTGKSELGHFVCYVPSQWDCRNRLCFSADTCDACRNNEEILDEIIFL